MQYGIDRAKLMAQSAVTLMISFVEGTDANQDALRQVEKATWFRARWWR
jgi:hypothetical protein